ncbi:MAG: helix-turn-helix domain-containing protein [Gammaproteobacteria bacterium]|nr:MAG: helix-turn-helix domain-containing protein [Gammaproteobacteria bacterium]UTW42672.1 helix-turn-helix domain-containing protein [bacterium SCSIO 12844]
MSARNTINEFANDLYDSGMIDKKTLRDLSDHALPDLYEFTGDEIKALREREKVSQAVFAKYLNISAGMVRSLEQGSRHAKGAILKLLNIVKQNGIKALG